MLICLVISSVLLSFSSPTEVADKIEKWLDEDKITYKHLPDENAYFHIQAIIGNASLKLIQPKVFTDQFIISFSITVSDEHRKALHQQDKAKKQEFLRKLRYELVNDPDVLGFEIVFVPNMPDDITGIGLRSHGIYYDELGKANLMHSIYNMSKKLFKISYLIEDQTGINDTNPKQSKYSPYG